MSAIARAYTTAVHDNFRPLYANWDPDRPVRLGDYGLLRGRQFLPLGDVRGRVPFAVRANPHPSHKTFVSNGATRVRFHARGAGPGGVGLGVVRARLEVVFAGREAVFFNAAGCTYEMVADKVALGRAVLAWYEAGEWDRAWAVVTDLIRAGSTTIVVAGGADAAVELEATGDVARIDLADAAGGLAVRSATNVGYQTVSARGLVPLLGLCKLRRAFAVGPVGFTPAGTAAGGDDPAARDDLYFGQVK